MVLKSVSEQEFWAAPQDKRYKFESPYFIRLDAEDKPSDLNNEKNTSPIPGPGRNR